MDQIVHNSNTGFRNWVQQMWYDHVDEVASYNQLLPYSSREYFNKYKFWLKREFQYQLRNTQGIK